MTLHDHVIAVQALAAGAVGAFLAAIGLTDQELIWLVFAACVVGGLRSPSVGRWRGLLLLGASMLITAKLAQSVSPALAAFFPALSVAHWRTLVAIGAGTMFYPTLQALWNATPAVVDRLAKRRTGDSA